MNETNLEIEATPVALLDQEPAQDAPIATVTIESEAPIAIEAVVVTEEEVATEAEFIAEENLTAEEVAELEATYDTTIFTSAPTVSDPTFADLGVAPGLVRQLNEAGIVNPTPIQAAAIPIAVTGRDLIGIAQTGTGKTLAFALPMVTRFKEDDRGVVLAPTRELAEQIAVGLQKIGLHPALLIGGAPMGRQISQLRGRCNLIVATPGRLMDHVMQGTVGLGGVSTVVLDEADRMLDMGFAPIIKRLLDLTPETRQTLLFSATMPKEIEELALSHMRNPARVEIAPQGTASELVEQEIAYVGHDDKRGVLEQLLLDEKGPALVFTRTRHGARKLAVIVREMGHHAGELHSDRTLAQRQSAMEGFRTGYHRVLVATDIAARGIDVKSIALIVNWDVPEHAEDYVHRIGRTGRAGQTGRAVTLVLREQAREVRDIEKLLDAQIPISDLSTVPAPVFHAPRQNGSRASGATANRRQRRQDRNPRPAAPERTSHSFSQAVDRMQPREENARPNLDAHSGVTEPSRPVRAESYQDRPQQPVARVDYDRGDRAPNEYGNRPEGNRPEGNRSYGDRTSGDRPYGNRPGGDRPSGDRPYGNRPSGDRPYGNRPSGDRPYNDRPSGDRPYGNRPYGDRPSGDRPYGNRPYGDRPSGDRPYGNRPGGDRPYGDRSSGDRTSGDRPYGNRPSGDRPYGDRPSGDRPYGNRPNGDRPYGNRPSGDHPYGNRPGGDRPYGDRPNGDRPYGNRPAGDSRPPSSYKGNKHWDNQPDGGQGRPNGFRPDRPMNNGRNEPGAYPSPNRAPKPFGNPNPGKPGYPKARPESDAPRSEFPRPTGKPADTNSGATPPKRSHRGWSGKPKTGR